MNQRLSDFGAGLSLAFVRFRESAPATEWQQKLGRLEAPIWLPKGAVAAIRPDSHYTGHLHFLTDKMTCSPFKPLSKEDAAGIFGVTTRTIENWIEHEGFPAPVTIGNRVFWHPVVFYEWLDQRLRQTLPVAATPVLPKVLTQRAPAGSLDLAQIRTRDSARVAAIAGG